MISIICCYNNENMYRDFVVDSLKIQETEFELIGINNSNKKYSSAAEAYNDNFNIAKGEYLLFIFKNEVIRDIIHMVKNRLSQ